MRRTPRDNPRPLPLQVSIDNAKGHVRILKCILHQAKFKRTFNLGFSKYLIRGCKINVYM
jgi:hypothetical protein